MGNSSKKKILLVEDEPHLAFNIEFNLQTEGYHVVPAANGQIALDKYYSSGPFDLVILDIMIPEVNGIKVAQEIRKNDKTTGILMLTAMAGEEDIITGLETGADDYMTKPFHLNELILRVNRMAERSQLFGHQHGEKSLISNGSVQLDLDSLKLQTSTGLHQLTVLEAKVMAEFLQNPGKIMTREYLLVKVWGINGNVETRTVDNFIMRLRKFVEKNPSKPQFLQSVRGRGYRFAKD